MSTKQRRALIILLGITALALLAGLAAAVFKWPRPITLAVYLSVAAVLTIRSIRRVFFVAWRMEAWDTFLADLASTDLSADPPLTRGQRQVSASLVIIARAVLWPKHLVAWLITRPLYRKSASGRLQPKISSPNRLFYLQFALDAGLFALLPAGLLLLAWRGQGGEMPTRLLFAALATNIFARHASMLVYPHELKASMRRTVGDPRLYFLVFLIIDTFTFAALLQFLAISTGVVTAGLNGFTQLVFELLSVAEVRGLGMALEQAVTAGDTGLITEAQAVFAQISALQAMEMVCSGFIYLNMVRMLLPLGSWKQTDEDLKHLARGFLFAGQRELAQAYLDKIRDYDVEAANLEAMAAASRGDLKAAAQNARWAHARNALPADPDLVFLDAAVPVTYLPDSQIDLNLLLIFALETKVSDALLTVSLIPPLVFERADPQAFLDTLHSQDKATDYPLCAAILEIIAGQPEKASQRLEDYAAGDIVAHCTCLVIKSLAESIHLPTPGPAIMRAAGQIADEIADGEIETLTLAQQLTLVSILLMLRTMLAFSGESLQALEERTVAILAVIRAHYPSHRVYTARLTNYARTAEAQALRTARRPAS